MKYSLQSIALLVIPLFILPLTVSSPAQSGEAGVSVEDAAVVVATVEVIDQKTRQIALLSSVGDKWLFTAGPEVRNFSQLKRGDPVVLSYFQAFSLALRPKRISDIGEIVELETTATKPVGEPAPNATGRIGAIGIVKTIDHQSRTVILQAADKNVKLRVCNEIDLSKLKVGDVVETDYVAYYAVQVLPVPNVSGTVKLVSTSIAFGIGIEWGRGTLAMNDGTTHEFMISGLSLNDVGISRTTGTGEVFNLVSAKDLNGSFVAGEAGIALGVGGSTISMHNKNNVIMELRGTQTGVKLTFGLKGLMVEMVE